MSQATVQFAASATGLLLLRVLSKTEFAYLTIAYSTIVLFGTFADMGVGSALRAIGGKLSADREGFGELFSTLLRIRMFLAAGALCILLPYTFLLLLWNGAELVSCVLSCFALLLAAIPLTSSTMFRDAGLVIGRYRLVQLIELAAAIARLILTFLLLLVSKTAIVGLIALIAASFLQNTLYRRRMQKHVDLRGIPSAEYKEAAWALMRRLAPNSLFFAFQGQISLVILTFLGATAQVAEVGALTRLSAIFSIVGAVFWNVLATHFGRVSDPHMVVRYYCAITLLVLITSAAMPASVYLFPQPFLWILGPRYAGLVRECVAAVTVSGISTVAGTLIAMNMYKSWISLYSRYYIPAAVVLMAILASQLRLNTVEGVLLFSAAVPAATVLLSGLDAIAGLLAVTATRRRVN